jgi:hypothetical protein
LESAINFLDVNDGASVNKILEESSIIHQKRAIKRNPIRQEDARFKTKNDEMQNTLKVAT